MGGQRRANLDEHDGHPVFAVWTCSSLPLPMRNLPSHQTSLPRRAALRSLAALAAGAAWLPWMGSSLRAADPPPDRLTSEPTGNPALDKLLTAFQFTPPETVGLSPTLALLSGPGGNVAALTGPAGALLVDTGIHAAAPTLAKAAEAFGGQAVSVVVNTHWHFDHAGGSEFFAQRGARIIAQDNTRVHLSQRQAIELLDYTFPPAPPAALPSLTFPEETTLYHGEETLRLLHVPPAHTDGDVLVRFAKENVLHTGDVFFNGFYPFIDYSTGGWIGGMVEAADRALALCDAQTRIIPGHGPLGTRADL